MTKGELIKALQDAPFGDNALIRIGHRSTNTDLILRADCPMDIDWPSENAIGVIDENELVIYLEPDENDSIIIQRKFLQV